MKNFFIALAFFGTTAAFGQSANLTTVMNNYAAFGKGDIPAILASAAQNCTWTHPGNASVPFAGVFKGPDGIGQFFATMGKSVAITTFEPMNFRESGNQVMNDVHIMGTALATGQSYEATMLFTWTFDAEGKVSAWTAAGDTSTLEKALAGK